MIVGPLAQNYLDEANGKHIIFDILLQLPTQHKFLVLIRLIKTQQKTGGPARWRSQVQQTNYLLICMTMTSKAKTLLQ